MSKLHFEDFSPGQKIVHGPRPISREEIVAFAAQFDPQPMHLDEDAGRNSLLGGLSASGWHSCSITMRMICDAFILNTASMGTGSVEEVKWLRPIHPGDQLTLHATVLETRASRSRPERGIVRFLFELFNGHGERVMTMVSPAIIGRRQADAAS